MERLEVISKEYKMLGDVILDSDLLIKWNAHIDYSKYKLSAVTK